MSTRPGAYVPVCVLFAAALSSNGCSIAFVQGPPPLSERQPHFECTDTALWPIVDLAVTALSALTIAGKLQSPSSSYSGKQLDRVVIIGGAVVGGLTALSGVVGLERISACDRAKAEIPRAPEPTLRLERRPAQPASSSEPTSTKAGDGATGTTSTAYGGVNLNG